MPIWIPEPWLSCPPSHLLIVAHGGSVDGLSFGHLARCKIVYQTLSSKFGTRCKFISRSYPEGIDYLKTHSLDHESIPLRSSSKEECSYLIQTIVSSDPDWVLIDSPLSELPASFYSKLRQSQVKVAYLDDCNFSHPEVDIYLNSSILAEEKMLERKNNTQYLLGPRYLIMPEAPFPPMETRGRRDAGHKVVTLSFGGSDPCGYTAKALSAIRSHLPPECKIRVILGPGFKFSKDFETACERFPESLLEIIRNPKEPYAYFLDSALVICAGGRTLYELYALKVPCLPIASIDHEKEHILGFHKQIGLEPYLLEWSDEAFIQKFNSVTHHLDSKRNTFESSLYPPT